VFDQGNGAPLIVIPGIQGRWEWMKPALGELKNRCHVVSYTLCGDAGSGMKFDRTLGFNNFMRQLDRIYETAALERAALCGVSYGGFIALRYAATRPERVTSLILSSSPAPGWVPNERQRRYVRRPWRSAPAFVAGAPFRLWPEIRAAYDTPRQRVAFSVRHAARVVTAPIFPPVMAERVTLQQAMDFTPDCARIKVPTLVVTGEDDLDRIVPAEVTRRYQQLIPGAAYVQMKRSGHLGLLTHPAEFADIVSGFVNGNDH
jgi:pimeloyl-ACP methyl ester carboxylesterase